MLKNRHISALCLHFASFLSEMFGKAHWADFILKNSFGVG